MKKVSLIVLALVATSFLAALCAFGQDAKGGNAEAETVEQQITALSDQAMQAYLKGDTNIFDRHFDDDYKAIHRDGTMSTKAQEIEKLKSDTLRYEAIDVLGKRRRTYGIVAVIVRASSSKGTFNGKPFGGDVLSTRIFVKQKGIWKEVASQSTRFPLTQ